MKLLPAAMPLQPFPFAELLVLLPRKLCLAGAIALASSMPLQSQTLLLDFTFEGDTDPVTDVFGGSFFTPIGVVFDSYSGGTNPDPSDLTYPCGNPTSTGGQSIRYTGWNTDDVYRFTINTQVSYTNLKWSFCDQAQNSNINQFVTRASHDGGIHWWYFGSPGAWDSNPYSNPPGQWTPVPGAAWEDSWQPFPAVFEGKASVWFEVFKVNNSSNSSYWFGIDNFRIHGDACFHPDKAALVELYEAAGGGNWTNTWDTTSCDVCNATFYPGVACNASGRVIGLYLENNNLVGALTNINLPLLQHFGCSYNQLSGNIPNFTNLPNLKYFMCQDNQLSGNIPNFTNLPNLQDFWCDNNQLSGSIPNFTNLPNLQDFWCDNNQLSGSIPNFTNLPNLQDFWCQSNQLSGSIPNFTNLPNLQVFRCQSNQLSGSIPNFTNLLNLQYFWCQSNQLSGCYPAFVCNLNDFYATNNPLLPWQGDHTNFCNGDPQTGAPCNNNQTTGSDEIQSDCTCDESCQPYNATLTANPTAICPGQSATLTFDFSAGTPPYDVVYSDGTSNSTLNNINSGHQVNLVTLTATTTYSLVSVTDNSGCTADVTGASATITVNQNPVANITQPTPPLCTGTDFDLTESNGQGTDYDWTGGFTGQTITISPLTPGTATYIVTVTNSDGCTGTDAVTFTVTSPPAGVSANANLTDICAGKNLDLNATGTGATTWLWDGPNGYASSLQNPPAFAISTAGVGTYNVTATASGNCTATSSVDINVFPAPSALAQLVSSLPICAGTDFELTENAGDAISWQWSGPTGFSSTEQNPIVTGATTANSGTYNVTITDANGCTATSFTSFTVFNPPAGVTATANFTERCDGQSLDLNASGTGAISWLWDGPNGYTSALQNPPAFPAVYPDDTGTYNVTATASSNCTAVSSIDITVFQTPNPQIQASSQTGNFCETEEITLEETNGQPGDEWLWSNGEDTQTITLSNLPPGSQNFSVTVTNADGCTASDVVNFTINAQPTVFADNNGPACEGDQINLSASGSGGNNWDWSGPNGFSSSQQNPPLPGLVPDDAGIYTVTLTSGAGCTATAETDVTVNPRPDASISIATDPICENGDLDLNVSSGSSIQNAGWSGPGGWSDNGESVTLFGVTSSESGIYSVTITDGNDCTNTASQPVSVNPLPNVNANADPAVCAGQPMNFHETGGDGQSWTWQAPDGTPLDGQHPEWTATEPGGTFSVTVTSAAGCTNTGEGDAEVFELPAISIFANTPLCAGLDLSLESGANGSEFSWTGPGGWTSDADYNLLGNVTTAAAGTYFVTVTNDDGCSASGEILVEINDAPTLSAASNSPVCAGGTLEFTANISGNFGNIQWSGPGGWVSTIEDPTRSPAVAGSYAVTVFSPDGNCSVSQTLAVSVGGAGGSATISAPPGICAGSTLTLDAGSGQTFSWSGPNGWTSNLQNPSIPNFSQNNAGLYAVTVSGGGGCAASGSKNIAFFTNPTAQITSSDPDNTVCEGQNLSLTATGGTSFQWPGGSTNATLNITQSGNYTVTVSNANGCTNSKSATATVHANPEVAITGDTDFCEGQSTVLTAAANGGSGNYTLEWSNGAATNAITITLPGTYTVSASDGNNCTGSSTAIVSENQNPMVSISGDLDFCSGEASTLTANVLGGSGVPDFVWSNNDLDAETTVLQSGTYAVTVTDANGCKASDSQPVQVFQKPSIASLDPTAVTCFGNSDGSLALNISGGTQPFDFQWNNPNLNGQQNPQNLSPGTYAVTVADANNCTASQTASVAEPPVLTLTCGQQSPVSANNASDGIGQFTIGGGTANFTLNWAGPNSTTGVLPLQGVGAAAMPNLAAGVYILTLTDASNCSATCSFSISTPGCSGFGPMTISATPVSCNGGSDGSLAASFTGSGTGNVNFDWGQSGLAGANPTGLFAGNYSLTATDAAGCTQVGTATVVQPNPLNFNALSTNADAGQANGSAIFSFSGGTSPFSVAISGGLVFNAAQSPLPVSGLAPGNFSAILTDANGCTATQNFQIKETGGCDPQQDSLIAMEFYDATGGAAWFRRDNWGVPGKQLGDFYGLETDAAGCIIQIDLDGVDDGEFWDYGNGNNLVGPIPASIGNLSKLRKLFLAKNKLRDGIPATLGNLDSLRHLTLDRNPRLGGPIPPELGNLKKLITLSLYTDSLWGGLPAEIGQLSNLETLLLGGNDLSGPLPPELGNLAKLRSLFAWENRFTGPIPQQWAGLASIWRFHLGDNDLEGPIPDFLGGLTTLNEVFLYGNRFSGPIPDTLANLFSTSQFQKLYLHNNDLESCFPGRLAQAICNSNLPFSDTIYNPGYNFKGNPKLPWQGDFAQFCTGQTQIGAACDDGLAASANDTIAPNCECRGDFCLPNPLAATLSTDNGTVLNCQIVSTLLTANFDGGNPPVAYAWSNNLGAADTARVLSPGSFTVTVSDFYGCTATALVTVIQTANVPKTQVAAPNGTTFDCQNAALAFSATASIAGSTFDWTWQGGSFSGANFTANTPGDYAVTLTTTAPNGCARDTIFNLKTQTPTFQNLPPVSVCAGQIFDFNGQMLSVSGTYLDTVFTLNGCDSIFQSLVFSVKSQIETSFSAQICAGKTFDWNGQVYAVPGNFQQILTSAGGCDSTVTLNLSLRPNVEISLDRQICTGSSFDFCGNNLDAPGIFTCQKTGQNGDCDTTFTLNLSLRPNVEISLDRQICTGSSFDFCGNNLDAPGIFTCQKTGQNGDCDTTFTLNLTVSNSLEISLDRQICPGETLAFCGGLFNQSGDFDYTCAGQNGACDTLFHLKLRIVDTEPPLARCKTNLEILLDASGQATLAAGQVDDGSFDNCSPVLAPEIRRATGAGAFSSAIHFDCADLPNSPVAIDLRVRDGIDSVGFCTASVVVRDVLPPSIACPPGKSDSVLAGQTAFFQDLAPTNWADNCGLPMLENSLSGPGDANGFEFQIGQTTVVYTASDASGNTATCSFSVQIFEKMPPPQPCFFVASGAKTDTRCGLANGSATVSATGANGAVSIKWSVPGVFDSTITGLSAGDFSATLTDAAGCADTVFFEIKPSDSVRVALSGAPFVCKGEKAKLTLTLAGTPPWAVDFWENGLLAILPVQASPFVFEKSPGVFELKNVRDAAGCEASAAGKLTVAELPEINTVFDTAICRGLCLQVGSAAFCAEGLHSATLASAAGCDSIVTVDLSFFDPEPLVAQVAFRRLPAKSDSLQLPILADGQPVRGGAVLVSILKKPASGDVEWLDSVLVFKRTVSDFSGPDSVFFEVCATNCPTACDSALAIFYIETGDTDENLSKYISDVISPNGDDKNYQFNPVDNLRDKIGAYVDESRSQLEIFGRWGERVFFDAEPPLVWDAGASNDRPLPQGTYYYFLRAWISEGEKKVLGTVTVLR